MRELTMMQSGGFEVGLMGLFRCYERPQPVDLPVRRILPGPVEDFKD
jgi:hypothetical protein